MSDVVWLSITEVCGDVGLFLSLTGNVILLVLLSGNSLEGIGSYRYLMVTFSIFSLLYTSIETFMRPLMHHYDNTIFVLQRKRFDFSNRTARLLSATYCGCFAMCFVLFAVHFLYRYYVACRPVKLLLFRARNYVLWVLGMLAVGLSWMAVAFFLFPEDDETRNSLRYVLSCYDLQPEEIGYVPYAFFHTVGSERKLRVGNFMGVVHHLTVMQLAITTVFFYGTKTYWSILRIRGKSKRTRDLQQQFFAALVVQTMIPLIFMFIPNSVLSVAAYVDGTFGAWANVTVVMSHLYPGVDPFVILFIIRGFRNTLKKFLCFRCHQQSVAVVSVISISNEKPRRNEDRSVSSVVF